jgi:hypothetical protein
VIREGLYSFLALFVEGGAQAGSPTCSTKCTYLEDAGATGPSGDIAL